MLISLFSFAFVFILVAMTHELGHFYFAKKVGIRVLELGIGFGPNIYRTVKDDTIYSINLIPILAYVRLAGIDNESEEDKFTPYEEQYYSKTPAQKFVSIAAGPIMNIIFGFVIFCVVAGFFGLPEISNEVSTVVKGSPAYIAGLMPGDVIEKFQGSVVSDPSNIISEIHKSTGKIINLGINRKGRILSISATAIFDKKQKTGIIGFTLGTKIKTFSPVEAIVAGAAKTYNILINILQVVIWLFIGKISILDVAGPIGIAQFSGQMASLGFVHLMLFTAFISLNLGVVNLLPIPALDGGRLVFVIIEFFRKKPINIDNENKIHQWGLIFLLSFMFIVSINDVIRILSPKIFH